MHHPKHCSRCYRSAVKPQCWACQCESDLRTRVRHRRAASRKGACARLAISPATPPTQPASRSILAELTSALLTALLPPRFPPCSKGGSAERSPYTAAELRRLFSAADYLDWVDGHPHRFWGPILGLCMGLRATEVARLRVDDLVLAYGHWCLSIASPNCQSESGQVAPRTRLVPVPPVVMAAGFLTFANHARASGASHLFPSLMAPRSGCDEPSLGGQRLAGQFALYTMLFEFTPRRVFKALRTTVAIRLAEQGLDVPSIEQLMGRRAKEVAESHGSLGQALLVDRVAHALAAVRWPMVLPSYDQHFRCGARC